MQDSQHIRTTFLEQRRALPVDQVHVKSAAIASRLALLPEFCQADLCLSYVASKDNEVDTRPIIERLLNDGNTVLVPIAHSNHTLLWSALQSWRELAAGRFGILEPAPEYRRIIAPPPDAVVLVPGLAFSPSGYRVGYGGGYYDRFLASHPGVAIGLAYDFQLTEEILPQPHDVAVNIIVTESQVYRGRATKSLPLR